MKLLSEFSNRELSLWGSLMIDFAVALFYFVGVYRATGGFDAASTALGGIIVKSILMAITASILLSLWVHIRGGEEPQDERDYMFQARANGVGFWTLFGCVAVTIWVLFQGLVIQALPEPVSAEIAEAMVFEATPVLIIHLLAFSLLLSDGARTVTRLFFYRRGF